MFTILGWIIYGFIVGTIAKVIFTFAYPSSNVNDVKGIYTILLGAAGSYVGGLINLIIGNTSDFGSTSGIIMGVVGATVALIGLHFAQKKGWLDQWMQQ